MPTRAWRSRGSKRTTWMGCRGTSRSRVPKCTDAASKEAGWARLRRASGGVSDSELSHQTDEEGRWYMAKPQFIPPKWRKPAPLAYGSALDMVSSTAAPLLAGFSLASVIVVADDAVAFRWPGVAMLGLAAAAIFMVTAVQCGFHARTYLWSASDVADWWPELKPDTPLEDRLRDDQHGAYARWRKWATATVVAYNAGLLSFLAGLAVSLPPKSGVGVQETLRWVTASIVVVACIVEVVLIVFMFRSSRPYR